jgi:hypothetical protein
MASSPHFFASSKQLVAKWVGYGPNNDALRDLPPPPPILAMFLDGETIAIEIRNVGG